MGTGPRPCCTVALGLSLPSPESGVVLYAPPNQQGRGGGGGEGKGPAQAPERLT